MGPVGTEVTITGSHFAGATTVTFNGTASSYAVLSETQIRGTVPSGATTGRIRVTTSAGTATSGSDFTVTAPPPAPTTLTFNPPHDAWVRSSSQSSNFGSRPELSIRSGSQTIRSYLKFSVTGVAGAIQSATLRLRVIDAGPDGGALFSVSNHYKGTSTQWTEAGLTWKNAPPLSENSLDSAGPVSLNTWVELDVTSAITGNGTYSFALSSSSSNVVDYSSSEGANPPELVVVVLESASKPGVLASASSGTPVPGEMVLHANRPNPFHAGTTIQYALPRAMPVRLVIYDVTGRAVRTLVDGVQNAGERQASWDGRNENGSPVGPGMYVYRLEAGSARLIRRMILLK
jgi:uncharacterized protein (TIGR03437 family)